MVHVAKNHVLHERNAPKGTCSTWLKTTCSTWWSLPDVVPRERRVLEHLIPSHLWADEDEYDAEAARRRHWHDGAEREMDPWRDKG